MILDRDTISPYLQLMRPSSIGSSYDRFVRPEIDRRTKAGLQSGQQFRGGRQAAAARGTLPPTMYGAGSLQRPSAYHQQWYGARGALR